MLPNEEYVANKVFVTNQVFIDNNVFVWKFSWQYGLRQIKYLSERSIDNTWASQIKFLSPMKNALQSSIYVTGQMTLLWLVSSSL